MVHLLDRCLKDHPNHLSQLNYSHYQSYLTGYSMLTGEYMKWLLNLDLIEPLIMADYKIEKRWPYNVNCAGFLEAAEGPEKALYKLLEYQNHINSDQEKMEKIQKGISILDWMKDKEGGFRKRPAMYFGNNQSCLHVWSCLSGQRWAETDMNHPGDGTRFMDEFQQWWEERFPFSKGIPWCRSLYFISLGSGDWSLKNFYNFFDLFMAGESPTSPSPSARNIMEEFEKFTGESSGVINDIIPKIYEV